MKRRILYIMMTLFLPVMALLAGCAFSADYVRAEEVPQTLPTVYLHIDGGQEEIEKMHSSDNHSYHCTGTMDIEVPEGFHYTDSDAELTSLHGLEMDIRGRGNTTWQGVDGKNPYKIKLDKKQAIFGMTKNKHWALIANAFDPSLMRNRITYWLGHELGIDYTPYCYPVDVYMEGEYYGSYLLCETIRVDKGRVDIDELTEEDNDKPDITGGYLMSVQQDLDIPACFTTDKGEDLQNISPSFDPGDDDYENDNQKNYIRNYVQEAEYALNEGYIADETQPSGYRKLDYKDYFDIKAASQYWLMQEFSRNNDAYKNGSTYFYKTRDMDGQKGKIFWGPIWDFDFAWDYMEFEEDDSFATEMGWMTAMMTDTGEGGLPDQIRKDWPKLKEKLEYVVQEGGLIDKYYEEVRISQAADYEKNQITDYENYEEAVNTLRQWIIRRIAWMDKRINDLDHYSHKVILKKNPDDEYPQVFSVRDEDTFSYTVDEPEEEGKVFLGWYTDQGENLSDLSITEETVVTARFIDLEEAVQPEKIYLNSYERWVPFSSGKYSIQYTLLPENVQDKNIKWTSSDETIATVNKTGEVRFLAKGEVTITGAFRNGLTASLKLHICDEDQLQVASSGKPSQEVIRMNPGEHEQLLPVISPENAPYTHYYFCEDEDVAEIDENGVITAHKEGKTGIRIFVDSILGEESTDFRISCQLIVGNPQESDEDDEDQQVIPEKSAMAFQESTFCPLRAKGVAKGNTSVKISWKKVAGAKAYVIYGGKYGTKNPFKKLARVTGTSFTHKKLKKGTYYKYRIKAVNGKKTLTKSKTIHVATKGGRAGDIKAVTTKARKNKVSLKKGKTFKLEGKEVAQSKKRKVKRFRPIAYESTNKKIATVSVKGKIKAVGKGTCYVYAYAQNGLYKKIKVTVR